MRLSLRMHGVEGRKYLLLALFLEEFGQFSFLFLFFSSEALYFLCPAFFFFFFFIWAAHMFSFPANLLFFLLRFHMFRSISHLKGRRVRKGRLRVVDLTDDFFSSFSFIYNTMLSLAIFKALCAS